MNEPTLHDVLQAGDRLRAILPPTPTVHSPRHGAHLKLDNLQVTGAFKVRGALNAIALQVERGDARPVIAASAGNHAQGVGWAARRFGLRACLVIPRTAPETKIAGCRRLGAEVILHGNHFDEALAHARTLADARGWRFLHPFDDPDVIAGQGTLALELLAAQPERVLVPVGGGGLAAGVGLVLRAHGISTVGVQVAGADAMNRILQGQMPLSNPAETMADGLRVQIPGSLTTQMCRKLLDGLVLVTEAELCTTARDLFRGSGILAEGAGAASVAALAHVSPGRNLAIISGGNVDPRRLDHGS